MIWRRRHSLTWDLGPIGDAGKRAVVQSALNACSFPFSRIRRRNQGARVPCAVSDLSRFAAQLAAAGSTGHVHIRDEAGTVGHLLGAPLDLLVGPGESARTNPGGHGWTKPVRPPVRAHDGEEHPPVARAAALGLYWLPTSSFPAGRVELDVGVFRNPDLAREVFLAEAAHAADYGTMTDGQRTLVLSLFEFSGSGVRPGGWFEEQGEEDYWSWRGERWMGLFMATYAPSLPRPLEPRQPWRWSYDAVDVASVKKILR